MGIIDLFEGKNPSHYYTCQIPEPKNVKAWVTSEKARDQKRPAAHWCSICCVHMILKAEDVAEWDLPTLFNLACEDRVFQQHGSTFKGAFHAELAAFIEHRFGLASTAVRNLSASDIMEHLEHGRYCMLSVHPSIRDPEVTVPPRRSGHFVLVYGYRKEGDSIVFFLQNSSGWHENSSQIGHVVSAERFMAFFSGNGVVVSKL